MRLRDAVPNDWFNDKAAMLVTPLRAILSGKDAEWQVSFTVSVSNNYLSPSSAALLAQCTSWPSPADLFGYSCSFPLELYMAVRFCLSWNMGARYLAI
jgi:hypothetical protein